MRTRRHDIAFASDGEICRGWFYAASDGGSAPAIIIAHGFSGTIEQGLDAVAQAFVDAGFSVLAFDYRDLGRSDGTERGRIIPTRQHDDLRAALAWLEARSDIDHARIALWGFSYSGGHALFLGALDPRVAAVVANAPALDILGALIAHVGLTDARQRLARLSEAHAQRQISPGQQPRIAIVASEGASVLGAGEAWDWFSSHRVDTWCETTTLESISRMVEYQPHAFVELISPKPMLVLAGAHDQLIPIAQVRAAFARCGEPKRLIVHDGGHFDALPGGRFHSEAMRASIDWLATHL